MVVAHPTALTLQAVRCFKGEQRAVLRPITLLVGENSTGKTTLLGCYAALHRLLSVLDLGAFIEDFNNEPFAMGSFREIVRSRRGPSGRINEFKLCFALNAEQSGRSYSNLAVTFRESGPQPVASALRFGFSDGWYLELRRTESNTCAFEIPDLPVMEIDMPFVTVGLLLQVLGENELLWSRVPDLKPFLEHIHGPGLGEDGVRRQHRLLIPPLGVLVPVAPLRSKPKRTYDPVHERASPDGDHVPMLMMRLDRTSKEHWGPLHDDLVEFGRSSGLFSDIKVKRHGKQMSDPFQLQVKVRSGPHANIMDVGYGISQSFPILVDIMAAHAGEGRTFLLQQPEVHLHPKGQAQLASLFVEAFKKRRNRFLIETHSDYIVDRVRIAVRQGKLTPDDVSILYFEPKGNAVSIHNMSVDADGNLLGAPASYREFFLRETDKLLGFAD